MTETPLQILHGCGLHPSYYDTLPKAVKGARELIRDLRTELADPPHDVQCAVLKKLGVEGFVQDEPPTCKIIQITEQ